MLNELNREIFKKMNLIPTPILYSFRRCPYAMRARMAIQVASIAVQTIEVALKNKPQSLLNYSPKGTVPVVVTSTGEVIEESRDIMRWALNQADPDDWLMKNKESAQIQMNQLIDLCDVEFKPWLDRYKYADRYPEYSQFYYREQAELVLQKLESFLMENDFLMDDKLRFVDVAIFPFIRQFAGVDKNWFESSPYKYLQRWLETCVNSYLFKSIMTST